MWCVLTRGESTRLSRAGDIYRTQCPPQSHSGVGSCGFCVCFGGYCVVCSPLGACQSLASPCHYLFLSCGCWGCQSAYVLNASSVSGAKGRHSCHRLVFLSHFLFLMLLSSPECSIHCCGVNMICALPLIQAPLGRWAFSPALVRGEAFGGWLNTGHQGRGL